MEISRLEMAAIRRTAKTVKPLITKRDKILNKINELQEKVDKINNEISSWEKPIVDKYSMTSEEILNGNEGTTVEVADEENTNNND